MARIPKMSPLGVVKQTLSWSFSASYLPVMAVVCSLTPKLKRTSRGPAWVRGWGRTVSRIAGVQIHYTNAAQVALNQRKARVMTFNHGSTLDVPIGAGLLPDGGVLIVKEGMKKIPFLGAACASVGTIFLNRDNRDEAYASLKRAAHRIVEENLQVLIAPEGTRSQDGTLGRFKTGAFHLAYEAQVPVLPIVIHGSARLWPRSDLAPSPGRVTIDVLPEFMVNTGETEALQTIANTLRDRYLDVLSCERRID